MKIKKKLMSLVISATLMMNTLSVYAGTISIDEAWNQLSSSQQSELKKVGLDKNSLNKIDSIVGNVDISGLVKPPLSYENNQFIVSQANAEKTLNMLSMFVDTEYDDDNMLAVFNDVIADINSNSSEKTRQDFARLLGKYGMVGENINGGILPEEIDGAGGESLTQEIIQENLEKNLLALTEAEKLNKKQVANVQKIIEILSSRVQEPLTSLTPENIQQAWMASIKWQENNAHGLKFAKLNIPVARVKTSDGGAITIPKGLWNTDGALQLGRLNIEVGSIVLSIGQNTYDNNASKVIIAPVKKEGYNQAVEISSSAKIYAPAKLGFYIDVEVPEEYGIYKLEDNKEILIGGIYNETLGIVEALVKSSGTYVLKKTTPKAYKDLTDVKWAENQINHLGRKGYIAGRSEDTYGPKDDITRAEFAVLLARILQLPGVSLPNKFADMAPEAWYYNDVMATVEAGLFKGKAADSFDPVGKVTRQELAAVISRILVQKGYSEPKLEEVPKGIWAPGALALLKDQSFVTEIIGFNDQVSKNANRAEVAYILYNLLQR